MENQIAEGAIYDIIDSSNYANDYDEKKTKEYETDLREIYDFVYNFFGNNYHRGDQLLVSEDLLKLVTDYFKNKTTKVGMKLKNVSQIYSNSDKYDEDAMHNVNDIIKVIDSAYHRAIDNRNTN
jgi:signal transduction histidine kinase